MIDPAKPFSSRSGSRSKAATAREDLAGLVKKAQDERFKLLKMLSEVRGQARKAVEVSAPPPPSEAQPTPTPAVGPLNMPSPGQMRDVLDKLVELDRQLDEKIERIEAIGEQPQAASPLERYEIDQVIANRVAAHVSTLSQQITERATEALTAFDMEVAERLSRESATHGEALARMGDTVLEDLDAQIAERGREAMIDLEDKLADAGSQLQDSVNQLDQQAGRVAEDARRSSETTIAEIERHAEFAAAREDEIYNAFVRKLDQLRLNHQRTAQKTTADSDAQLSELAEHLDHHVARLAEGFEQQAQRVIAELRERANAMLEQMASTVQSLTREPDDRTRDPHPRAA